MQENVACTWSLESRSFLFSAKTGEHRDFSFRCTCHVVGIFRSTALNRVKLLTVDYKDILELKVVAFASTAGNDDVVVVIMALVIIHELEALDTQDLFYKC